MTTAMIQTRAQAARELPALVTGLAKGLAASFIFAADVKNKAAELQRFVAGGDQDFLATLKRFVGSAKSSQDLKFNSRSSISL
jgi:ABC-type thiamin/hydroxymethylpyrimidine transport system permease subunit